eukprot:CAMPEP_0202362024 /NCGR_PEP_ID=MMETSP1126-20121109/14353_1 /ASSEMBLY_ACC=CAM_ASM_000457 /TAXON_ID=3047 /ORGANISM="Dunaliella tertiolecta, Strain CCMP1320" /LENGTH=93 /DNA_ID=CAMNT_0048956095 /DNA_START=220 /DNA_END=501 /DNA_ORIENTATION=-
MVVGWVVAVALDHGGKSHDGGACCNQNHAQPMVQVQASPQDQNGQAAGKQHQSPPQHLKRGGKRVKETDVEQRSGCCITEGGDGKGCHALQNK